MNLTTESLAFQGGEKGRFVELSQLETEIKEIIEKLKS